MVLVIVSSLHLRCVTVFLHFMFAVCVIMRILPLRRRRLPQTRSRYLVHAAVLSSIVAVLDLAKNRRPSSVCLQLRLRPQRRFHPHRRLLRRKSCEQALRCTFTKALSEATSGASRPRTACTARTARTIRAEAELSRFRAVQRRRSRARRRVTPDSASSGKSALSRFRAVQRRRSRPDAA